jgi:DNA primase
MDIKTIILQKIDLPDFIQEYTGIDLINNGNTWRSKCPIHGGENENSFTIFPNNTYYCFACNSCGNVINFIADYEHISYHASIEKLAYMLNIDLTNDKEYQLAKDIESHMSKWKDLGVSKEYVVDEYLKKDRGFTEEIIKTFELGSDKGSLTIPLIDENSRYVGMAKRQFDKKPKYVNNKNNEIFDKSAFLFNLDKARRLIHKSIYLVEGYMDAISGHQMGIPTIAYCSNGICKQQIVKLSSFLQKDISIIIVPDNDEEGKKRLPKIRSLFNSIDPERQVRILPIPDGFKDMNDMLLSGINVLEIPTVHIDKYVFSKMLDTCESIEEEYKIPEQYLKTVHSPMIKLDLVKFLAKRWNEDLEFLKKYYNAINEDSDDIISRASDVFSCVNDLKSIYKCGTYKTHFENIDKCINGIQKKEVCIIGAQPSVGKSDFAVELILKFVLESHLKVVFFSLEMPRGKLMERILAKMLGCPLYEVEGYLASSDTMVEDKLNLLKDNLIVFDENNITIDDIEKRIKLINAKGIFGSPIDVVVVDYFGYLKGTSTYEEASGSALKMKPIAKNNNLIFVMLSQLNRSSFLTPEPSMGQLKSTGDLEATGDIIMLMWRPEKISGISLDEKQKLQYVTRIKIEKARDGIFGPNVIDFKYSKSTSRLEEVLDKTK